MSIQANTTAANNKSRDDITAALEEAKAKGLKVKTAPKPTPVKPATEKKATKAKKQKPSDERVIALVVTKNPKRGASAARFDLYKDGQTVEAFIAAGGRRADINWDLQREFIKVAATEAEAVKAAKEARARQQEAEARKQAEKEAKAEQAA